MRYSEKLVTGFIVGLVALSLFIGFITYSKLPEKIPSHWNAQGDPDSYMDKSKAILVFPGTSVLILLGYLVIPRIDPLKENIEKFRVYFDGLIGLIVIFLFYLNLMMIGWGLGLRFNIGRLIAPVLALLFFYIGVLLGNAKRNWFIGIRTPWTLSSEEVWNDTHRRGSKLFKAAGLIALIGVVLPEYGLYIAVVPVVLVSIYLVAYSYFRYRGTEEINID